MGGGGLWRRFQAVGAGIELTRGNPGWCGRISSWGETFMWEWVSESDPQDTARSRVWSPMMGSDPRELLHPFLVRTRRKDRASGFPAAPASRAVSRSWRSGLALQQLWTHICGAGRSQSRLYSFFYRRTSTLPKSFIYLFVIF